ncbi:alpha-N-acetylglucosaminidase TIM-barrel domain-containing protein [Streptomyces sp. NPDC005151]
MTRRRTFLLAMSTALGAGLVPGPAAAAAAADGPFDPAPAAAALRRLIGNRADQISLRPISDSADTYRVSGRTAALVIEGTSPATMLAGFQRYLGSQYRGVWWVADNLDLPGKLPAPAEPLVGRADVPHRFALNDTNDGYTEPYGDFTYWQREIDLLALHGCNEVLLHLGADAVYHDTFREFGYTDEELRAWIPGAAHQPWWLLQNMTGFAGPVSGGLRERRAALSRQIIDHVRALGMAPVLPGYYGTVPPAFADKNPGAAIVPQGTWCGFKRPDWIDPRDEHFARIAEAFYRHSARRYGTTSMYKLDLLHEGGTPGPVPVGEASAAVETALRAAHPDAIWVILGWQDNPRTETLAAVDTSRMLIVDGLSERPPAVDREKDWSGTPYAFGTIFNFGGKTTLGGAADRWLAKYRDWRDKPNSALAGIALMPEAADNNDAALDVFTSLAWTTQRVDAQNYFTDYAARRYGGHDAHAAAAWSALARTAYADTSDKGEPQDSLFCAQPSLSATTGAGWSPTTMTYQGADFDTALTALLRVSPSLRRSDAYRHDLVDVARQALTNRARILLPRIHGAYQTADRATFDELTDTWLGFMNLLARLVSTRPEYLLGPRLARAREAGLDQAEADQLEFDQRSILTVWGDRSASVTGGLHDYANREWDGLIRDVYRPRWAAYFAVLRTALRTGRPPVPPDWFALADAWARDHTVYPQHPRGDEYGLAAEVWRVLAADTHQVDAELSTDRPVLLAGGELTASGTVTNRSGLSDADHLAVSMTAPDGVTGAAAGPTTSPVLAGGASADVTWRLTAPADWRPDGVVTTLSITADYRVGRRGGRVTVPKRILTGAPVGAPYAVANFNAATFVAAGDELGIHGGGRDMWGGTHQFGAIYLPGGFADGATATVLVTTEDSTGQWARAGIVVRNSLATNGSTGFLNLAVTPAHGCAVSADRNGDGKLETVLASAGWTAPVWLRLSRTGDRFDAECSADRTTWTAVAGVTVPTAAARQDVGVFFTAANGGSGATGLATFREFTVTEQ